MKASDLLVAALEAEGVEYIFAAPGEENLDLLESLRTSSIRLIVTRHEQGAGFMAAAYGRLTGKAGVCLATLGPGATNLTTPAAYAALGAFPLVMITGQKPIKVSKQAQFQIVDVVSLFTPLCKMAKQIVNGERIPSLVREGFRRAHTVNSFLVLRAQAARKLLRRRKSLCGSAAGKPVIQIPVTSAIFTTSTPFRCWVRL